MTSRGAPSGFGSLPSHDLVGRVSKTAVRLNRGSGAAADNNAENTWKARLYINCTTAGQFNKTRRLKDLTEE